MQIDEDRIGWIAGKQKLLCLIVLDDEVASVLNSKAGEAFLRGFITEDRATGAIEAKMRFRYVQGDHWYRIPSRPNETRSRAEIVADLQEGLTHCFHMALQESKADTEDAIQTYWPPNDEDDTESRKTLAWLLERDLMQITRVEKVEK